jgi:hypothetical protein
MVCTISCGNNTQCTAGQTCDIGEQYCR